MTTIGRMPGPVNAPSSRRRYDASGRRRAAERTKGRILDAARDLFLADGYPATTVTAIAEGAGVSPDTVYTAVGTKPVLFRELVELALSGARAPVPGRDHDYARAMRAEPDLRARLGLYAVAVTRIQQRLAPLFLVLRDAAAVDADLRRLWTEITERRARNMRELAADLATAPGLRPDLSREEVADVIWTMNGTEYYALLVLDRGWSPDRFRAWLHDAWCRLLLEDDVVTAR